MVTQNSDFPLNIDQGSINNPYREFTFTIPAFQTEKVFNVFNYFRCLNFTGNINNFKVRFGGSGAESDFSGSGLGFKLDTPVQFLELINKDSSAVTITIALCVGQIYDDRVTFQAGISALSVKEAPYSNRGTGQVSVGTGAAVKLGSTNPVRAQLDIYAGTTDLYIGAAGVTIANGFLVPAGGYISLMSNADWYGIRAVGTNNAGYIEQSV